MEPEHYGARASAPPFGDGLGAALTAGSWDATYPQPPAWLPRRMRRGRGSQGPSYPAAG
uniref:Uncharacterized protein n=1 Tax=Arundo donax TaxID=35708 RepID=A0A0A8Z8T5_ARUDO